jgi:hypothetical protein
MDTEGKSPCSNQNPELDKACPRNPILFFKANFNIILQFTPGSAKSSPSFRFPHQNPVCTSPLHVPHATPLSTPSR